MFPKKSAVLDNIKLYMAVQEISQAMIYFWNCKKEKNKQTKKKDRERVPVPFPV